jgi:hypothetical protein
MRRKKKAKNLLFFSALMFMSVTCALWLQQGCKGNYAPMNGIVATATPSLPSDVISDFGIGTTLVNPTLLGTTQQTVTGAGGTSGTNTNGNSGSVTLTRNYAGYFNTNTYGGSRTYLATPTPNPSITPAATPDATPVTVTIPANTINNPFILPNPGNGDNYALWINTPLSGTGAYEADQVNCYFTSNPNNAYYDASSFTGIQFDMYIASNDTNNTRVLGIPIDLDTPVGTIGGTCLSDCFNPHQVTLPSSPTNSWQTVSFTWSQFQRPSFVVNPYAPFSAHLTKIINLQWSFSDNGAVTVTQTDVRIDNVKFLP